MESLKFNEIILLVYLWVVIVAYYCDGLIPRMVSILMGLLWVKNIELHLFTAIIGLLGSSLILRLEYFFLYRIKLKNKDKLCLQLDIIVDAIFEEIMWRDIIYYLIIKKVPTLKGKIFLILFFSLLFVFIHQVQNYKSYLEMFIYTLMLWMSVCMGGGAHYGLHIGRNLYLNGFKEYVHDTSNYLREKG